MTHSLFAAHQRLAHGSLADVALTLARTLQAARPGPLLAFDDATGQQLDLDVSGSEADIVARYAPPPAEEPVSRGPGRPRLGVVAREVTLLPHHWEWLNAQPGGASVTLRKLVEQGRKAGAADERARRAREAAYRFLHAACGDLPDFEEVTRALFAGDAERMDTLMHAWPADVRAYAVQLATPPA